MKLLTILDKNSNNLDLFRLFAAAAVIVGHAYAISPEPPLRDGVSVLLGFDYSGSLAVKFFFFLSGLLVANSIRMQGDLISFLISRCARLFPGLIFCVLVSACLVGGVFTSLKFSEYIAQPDVYSYLTKNIALELQWNLPGVFNNNPLHTVNGSLWTLPVEFFCYMGLSVFGALGLLKNNFSATALFVLLIAAFYWNENLLPLFGLPADAWMLPMFFCVGAILAVNKNAIDIDWTVLGGLFLASFLVRRTQLYPIIMPLAIFISILFFSSWSVIRKIRLPGDFSYGVYLYGFPVQQISKTIFPEQGVHANQAIGLAGAVVIGAFSWFAVERPSIRLGKKLREWRSMALTARPVVP